MQLMVTERFGLENIPGTRSLDWNTQGQSSVTQVYTHMDTTKDWLY